MNPQPVSLADELRKLVEKWPHQEKLYGDPQIYYCHRCAVEALLAQHAQLETSVAEKLSNGMKSASRLARQLGKRVAPQKEDGK